MDQKQRARLAILKSVNAQHIKESEWNRNTLLQECFHSLERYQILKGEKEIAQIAVSYTHLGTPHRVIGQHVQRPDVGQRRKKRPKRVPACLAVGKAAVSYTHLATTPWPSTGRG